MGAWSCVEAGPGGPGEGYCAPECESPQWWGVGSGLAVLQAKVALAGVSFTVSRNGLALGGAVPSGSAGLGGQSIKVQK